MYCLPKFGQLILTKIIKIVATRCQISRPKCVNFDFGWGSAPDPAERDYSTPPDTLAGGEGDLLLPSPRTSPLTLDPSGLDPAVLMHFFPPTLKCLSMLQTASTSDTHALRKEDNFSSAKTPKFV